MKALKLNFLRGLSMSSVFLLLFFYTTSSFAQWQIDAPNSMYHLNYKVGIGTDVPNTRLMVVAPDGENIFRLKNLTNTVMFVKNNGKMGIGTITPDCRVNILSDSDENPLRVKSGALTSLFAHQNGGVTIGSSTNPPEQGLKVAEGGTVLFGADTIGPGSKMMWLPSKSAFRGGEILNGGTGVWQPANIGDHSFAFGLDPSAEGWAATAFGKDTKADGNYAFAAGYGSEATGVRSVALGNHTKAIGRSSVALGKFNVGLTNSLLEIGMGDDATQRENAFTILSGGKVGVGTTSVPSDYLMAVEGDLICEGVRVELSQNWPDYVFTKEYQLPTLDEVKAHIDEKGHLPNIPAASKLEAEGLDLGDMQIKMMEKIEELTLYILQQEERIRALEGELEK